MTKMTAKKILKEVLEGTQTRRCGETDRQLETEYTILFLKEKRSKGDCKVVFRWEKLERKIKS